MSSVSCSSNLSKGSWEPPIYSQLVRSSGGPDPATGIWCGDSLVGLSPLTWDIWRQHQVFGVRVELNCSPWGGLENSLVGLGPHSGPSKFHEVLTLSRTRDPHRGRWALMVSVGQAWQRTPQGRAATTARTARAFAAAILQGKWECSVGFQNPTGREDSGLLGASVPLSHEYLHFSTCFHEIQLEEISWKSQRLYPFVRWITILCISKNYLHLKPKYFYHTFKIPEAKMPQRSSFLFVCLFLEDLKSKEIKGDNHNMIKKILERKHTKVYMQNQIVYVAINPYISW